MAGLPGEIATPDLMAPTREEAVPHKATRAGPAVEGREAWQRLAGRHARHPPPLQLLPSTPPTSTFTNRSGVALQPEDP